MKFIKFANVLVVNRAGEILVLRRSASHPTRPLQPDLPGGGVEARESFAAAAVREIREETGLIVDQKDLVVVRSIRQRFSLRSLYGALFVMKLANDKPMITLSYEHDKYEWIQPSKITNLPYFHQESLGYALRNNFLYTTK